MKKLILVILVTCAACTTPVVVVKKNVTIEKLGIYLETGAHAMPLMANAFDQELDSFIRTYNADAGRRFRLFRASEKDSTTLKIKLIATSLVTPGQQTAGVVVSMIGLSLPFVMVAAGAPIWLGFYYFPDVRSMTELSLSPDISNMEKSRKDFLLSSPGFLMSPEKQIDKHIISFDRFLKQLVNEVKKQTAKPQTTSIANY